MVKLNKNTYSKTLKQIQTNRNFVLNVGSIPTLPTIVWLFKWEGWNVGVVRKGEKKYSDLIK